MSTVPDVVGAAQVSVTCLSPFFTTGLPGAPGPVIGVPDEAAPGPSPTTFTARISTL